MARFLVFGLLAAAMLLCLIVEAQADGSYDYKSPVYKAGDTADKYKPAPKTEEEKKYKEKEEAKYYKAVDKEKEEKEKKYKEDKEKEDKEKKYKEDKEKEDKEKNYKNEKEKEDKKKYKVDKEKEDKYKADKDKEEKEKKYKEDKEKEEKAKKYKAEEKKFKPDYKPDYNAADEKKYKEEKPSYKPVAKPSYAPKRVSIEGYVYCQDGSSKKPLEGAVVSLGCAKSKDMREKTNGYGYFYFPLGYGAYKDMDMNTVKIVLVSSPSKNCYIATNVNDGKSGAKVIKSKSKVVGDTLIYEVGPFAFAPAVPAYKSPYHY